MLVGVVLGPTFEAALKELKGFWGRVDLAEIRLDSLEEAVWGKLDRLILKSRLPLIFTFRRREGMSEKKRLALFERALALGPAFADLETDTDRLFLERMVKTYPTISWIGSHHDFEKTPEDLASLLDSMKHPCFSMYKLALQAHSTLDLMRLMAFGREMSTDVPLSCISMGEYGQPSRVLGPIIGNILNYTSLRDSMGPLFQFNLDVLHSVYGFFHLNRSTKIYALLGDPVEGSRGAQFHNEIFRKEGAQAVYVKLRLTAADLPQFFAWMLKLPFAGLSVTRPLKEKVLPFLTEITPLAKAIGAVNTVTIQGGHTVGSNTDASGALEALEMHGKVKGVRMAILGAGGSARAVAYEALARGAQVTLFNRTIERAEKIGKELGCQARPLEALAASHYDLLVNTIPLTETFSGLEILPKTTVLDINNSPGFTPFLQEAKEKGCRCIHGNEMFEQQAYLQQIEWKKALFGF